MRFNRSSLVPFGSVIALLTAQAGLAVAKPLDPDTCARLKVQREALEKSGIREALNQSPPGQVMRALDERAQQMRTLIDVDGQLRFRCAMELPIASLKPELLVEVPDTVEGGEAAAKQAAINAARQKALAARRAKAAAKAQAAADAKADAAVDTGVALPQGAGVPVTPKRKTAVAKPAAAADGGEAPAKPAAKPKPKTDDAFRAVPNAKGE